MPFSSIRTLVDVGQVPKRIAIRNDRPSALSTTFFSRYRFRLWLRVIDSANANRMKHGPVSSRYDVNPQRVCGVSVNV